TAISEFYLAKNSKDAKAICRLLLEHDLQVGDALDTFNDAKRVRASFSTDEEMVAASDLALIEMTIARDEDGMDVPSFLPNPDAQRQTLERYLSPTGKFSDFIVGNAMYVEATRQAAQKNFIAANSLTQAIKTRFPADKDLQARAALLAGKIAA